MKYKVEFEIELQRNPHKGLYIALEGIDGSGKTTQAVELQKYFESIGKKVLITHEPRRDGIVGPLIHDVLIGKTKIPEVAIQYLLVAGRVSHLEDMVIPALKRGDVVISDRCFWSSIPYGLLDRFESSEETMDRLLASFSVLSMYHQFITPDLSVFLDVTVKTAADRIKRLKRKTEIYEKEQKLSKVKNGYDFLMNKFPGELTLVDADREIQDVTKDIIKIAEKIK